jgi:Flp pilus assembly protein TadB
MAGDARPGSAGATPRGRRRLLVVLAAALLVASVCAAAVGVTPLAVVLFVLAGAALSPLTLPAL